MMRSDMIALYPGNENTSISRLYRGSDFKPRYYDAVCNDPNRNQPPWFISAYLVDVLEFMYDLLGLTQRPVITSAYRNSAQNRKIGGACESGHLSGGALDVYVPGIPNAQIAGLAHAIGVPTIGYAAEGSGYTGFVELNIIGNRDWGYNRSSSGKYSWRNLTASERDLIYNQYGEHYRRQLQGVSLPDYVRIPHSAPALLDRRSRTPHDPAGEGGAQGPLPSRPIDRGPIPGMDPTEEKKHDWMIPLAVGGAAVALLLLLGADR